VSPTADEQTAQWRRPKRPRGAPSPPLGSKPPPLRTDGPLDKHPPPDGDGATDEGAAPSPTTPAAAQNGSAAGSSAWPVAQVARNVPDAAVTESSGPEQAAQAPPLGSAPPARRIDGPVPKQDEDGPSGAATQPAPAAAASSGPPAPAEAASPATTPATAEPEATQPMAVASAPQPTPSTPTGTGTPPPEPAPAAPTAEPEAPPPSVPPPRPSQRPAPASVRPPPSAATAEPLQEGTTDRRNDRQAAPPSVGASPPSRASGPGAAQSAAVAATEGAPPPPPSRTSGPGTSRTAEGRTAEGPSSDELERAQRALDHSRKALSRAEGKIKELSREAEALRDRMKQTERALDQKVDELEKFVGQHDSARSLVAVRAERIRELEAALVDQEREAAAERQRLAAEHEQRIAVLEDDMKRRLANQELIATDLRTQIDRFGTPRPVVDDLLQIRGIGPAYARKLRAAGVRSYARIAGWSDQDIDDIAAKLQIHAARIRRADWVGSARELLTPRPSAAGSTDEP